jgi:hypothetical protein
VITNTNEFIPPLTDDDIHKLLEFIEVELADDDTDLGDVRETLSLVHQMDICGALLDARKEIKALKDEVVCLRNRIEFGDEHGT